MINLIPGAVRTAIIKEYWVRVATVAFFIFSGVLVAVVALALPVYVLISTQVDAYATSANEAAVRVADFEVSSSELTEANMMSRQIMTMKTETNFMSVVEMVDTMPKPGVSISSYVFGRAAEKIAPIQISGVAATRQSLASFRDSLLAEEGVADVVLPISNLAKDKDIEFTLTVTMK